MKTWTTVVLAGTLMGGLLLAALPAQAGVATPDIDQRQANQQARIYQGLQSGKLTPGEFNRLERQQARIQATKVRAKADGRVTRRERARLHAMLDQNSRSVVWNKHNNRRGW